MCGICGVIGIKSTEAAEAVTRRMMAAMHHRGPDDEGLFVREDLALGMRRLSIIDLAGGQQPVFNEDGSVVVVFNGEIYNFQALRQTLEARGHVFRTRCDTEVIAHAYEEWGTECTHHLQGMFALAVYDRRQTTAGPASTARGHLFLARDRLGIKPLYYYQGDGYFLFASEVRTLLASGLAPRRLSVPALQSYLLFGSVVEPMTMVEGVFSLPPGHHMLIPIDDRTPAVHPQPYWDFAQSAITQPSSETRDRTSTTKRLRPLLEESVRLHLIADVPLGIFLSSGIDSTALAALASRARASVHTVTVVFPEQAFSEAEPARRTAQRLGTTHHELMLSSDEMLARLDAGVAALDQPSMDGINTYFVSWAARQAGLKVALSGLGGDEVFGGYGTFRWAPRLQRLTALGQHIPNSLRSLTASALAGIAAHRGSVDAGRKLAAWWRDPGMLPHPYFFTRALFTPAQVSSMLNGAQNSKASSPWWTWLVDAARQAEHLDDFTAVSYLELRSYLVNTLLRDTDSMSMAHSLEVRVPFLDHPLVEFVAQLPGPLKQRRGITKALLVEALGNLLPSEVVHQPKRTFTFPWERWLRGALREQVAAGLAGIPPALQPVLSNDTVQSTWQDFLAGRTGWSRPWSLYVLNAWVRRHL